MPLRHVLRINPFATDDHPTFIESKRLSWLTNSTNFSSKLPRDGCDGSRKVSVLRPPILLRLLLPARHRQGIPPSSPRGPRGLLPVQPNRNRKSGLHPHKPNPIPKREETFLMRTLPLPNGRSSPRSPTAMFRPPSTRPTRESMATSARICGTHPHSEIFKIAIGKKRG